MIRIVRLSFHPQYVEEFRIFFDERKMLIRNFPGCNCLELWQDQKEAGVFYTYSNWDKAADLESYRSSKLFENTWAQVKQWFSDAPQAFSAGKLISLP